MERTLVVLDNSEEGNKKAMGLMRQGKIDGYIADSIMLGGKSRLNDMGTAHAKEYARAMLNSGSSLAILTTIGDIEKVSAYREIALAHKASIVLEAGG